MTLAEFRAARRYLTREEAESEAPHIMEMEYDAGWTHVILYSRGEYIMHGRKGFYLHCETDEYESRDLALLEFVLWQWSEDLTDNPEAESLRAQIWG